MIKSNVYWCLCVLAILLVPVSPLPLMAQADSDDVDGVSEVLVLATPHLRSYSDVFNAEALEPVLAVLEEYAPDIIAIEWLSLATSEQMKTQGKIMASVLDRFGAKMFTVQRLCTSVSGLNRFEAEQRAVALLAQDELTTTEREYLILYFGSAGDRISALLHYSVLRDEIDSFAILPEELRQELDAQLASHNESIVIALELAKRLELTRIASIDDHADKDIFLSRIEEFEADFHANEYLKTIDIESYGKERRQMIEKGFQEGSLLPVYEYFASDEYARQDKEQQWSLFQKTDFPSKTDRMRLAAWDVRNMEIAANIRRAMAEKPGGRTLVIIGAAHRSWLEEILSTGIDVRVRKFGDLVDE